MQVEIEALRYTQEEGYTRRLLHAAHTADHALPAVVIRSPDSDVAVIALSVAHQLTLSSSFAQEPSTAQDGHITDC